MIIINCRKKRKAGCREGIFLGLDEKGCTFTLRTEIDLMLRVLNHFGLPCLFACILSNKLCYPELSLWDGRQQQQQ